MLSEQTPMTVGTLRRLMSTRSVRAHLEQRRNERGADRSRMGIAIGLVLADRKLADWGWLDQDSASRSFRP